LHVFLLRQFNLGLLYLFSATTKDGEIELYILYSVPFLKSNCNVYGKTVTVDDFRSVSISPVISKVFEHCVLDRCGAFFGSSDNQFGF